jgi:DHA3 family macrolide efflux protein-like MFS transporter
MYNAPESASATPTPGMPTFLLISLGQLLSMIGSTLNAFALGVWVYQASGRATEYALIGAFAILPRILAAPFAGVLVDRLDRRKVILVTEGILCGCSVVTLLLLRAGNLQLWHIYSISAFSAVVLAFLLPAYGAIVAVLVPKDQLARANGISQASFAIAQIFPPLLAGLLVTQIGITGVLAIDVLSFVFPILMVMLVRIPSPPPSAEGQAGGASLRESMLQGWRYIRARPGILGMLALFAVGSFLVVFVFALMTPLMLSFSTPAELGLVLGIGGGGMLLGSIVMGVLPEPRRRIHAMLGYLVLTAVALVLIGLRPSVPLIAGGLFGLFFTFATLNGLFRLILQNKIVADMQGRVFSLSDMIVSSAQPVSFLVAGPLADMVFAPLLLPGGALAGSVGQLVGVGPGRGIGLLFVVAGIFMALTALGGALYPRLRNLDTELPDILSDEPASPSPATALPLMEG